MVGSKQAGVTPVMSLSSSSSVKPTASLAAILAIGKPGGLGGQRGGAAHAGVHLDDHHAAIGGVHGPLHVGAAGFHADLAQDRDRVVAHDLVFLVGQRQGRSDGDRIAGMHAHRVDVFDRADDDGVVGGVAHHLHLVFLPAQQAFVDEDLAHRARRPCRSGRSPRSRRGYRRRRRRCRPW